MANTTDYYNPSQGSLTGFDLANIPTGNPNLAETGWSISDLKRFLLNTSDVNFPSAEFVLELEAMIEAHLDDFNNPHKVSLDQIVGDFVKEVLGSITPGTPPDIPPFYSFDALANLPIGDVFPATYSSTNFYRMTSGGTLVNPATAVENLGTDYTTNKAGVPLFSSITNVVPANWATQGTTVNNTTIAALADPTLVYPFSFYELEEINTSGQFGVLVPTTQALATVYTFTVYVAPTATGGYVILSLPSDTAQANIMTVSLADGTYTLSSTLIVGETFVYPNGVIRISYSFTSGNPTADTAVQISHLNAGDVTPVRQGTAGRTLFSLASPFASKSVLNQPTPINGAVAATTTPLVFALNKVGAPATFASCIITLALDIYPTLSNATAPDAAVFTFGTLTVTRDQTNLYVKVAGTTVFTSALLNGLNIISLSYSPTTLIFKDLASDRQTATGTYAPLATTTVTAGPCSGYLSWFALYAMADTNQCVEYLTNG